MGRPQVVYRETLAKPADGEARFERVVEDETLFGHARVHVAPRPRASGNELKMQIPRPAQHPGAPKIPETPQAILDAAMDGAREAMHSGPQGYPIEDISVTIIVAATSIQCKSAVPHIEETADLFEALLSGHGFRRSAKSFS